jgi:hypothetical protein
MTVCRGSCPIGTSSSLINNTTTLEARGGDHGVDPRQ